MISEQRLEWLVISFIWFVVQDVGIAKTVTILKVYDDHSSSSDRPKAKLSNEFKVITRHFY